MRWRGKRVAAIEWTDAEGPAVLRSRFPAPADRLYAWTPVPPRVVGEHETILGTGQVVEWVYRRDYGVTCELRGISAHTQVFTTAQGEPTTQRVAMLDRAERLVAWLIGGGSVTLLPEGYTAGVSYACTVLPGSTPDLKLADAQQMEYTLSLGLRNSANARMPYPYAFAL